MWGAPFSGGNFRETSKVGMTIGVDLGDVWSHYCTLNED